MVLIGFQPANRNHLKSHEVAVRVTMLCKPIGTNTVQVYTHHGVRSESTSNNTRLQLKSIPIGTVYTLLVTTILLGDASRVARIF